MMIEFKIEFSGYVARDNNEFSHEAIVEYVLGALQMHGIDGANLAGPNLGIWKGQTENSYTLTILASIGNASKVEGVADTLRAGFMQDAVILHSSPIADFQEFTA